MDACFLKGQSSFVLRGSHFCFSWEPLFFQRWIHFCFRWEPFLFFFFPSEPFFLGGSDSSRSRFLPHPLTVHNVVPACLVETKTDQSDGGTKKETCSRTKNKEGNLLQRTKKDTCSRARLSWGALAPLSDRALLSRVVDGASVGEGDNKSGLDNSRG